MIYHTARPTRTMWIRAALFAAVVHVGALGALFVRITPAVDPMAEMPAIAVELAAPSAPPAPIHDAPTPRQIEAPEQVLHEQPAPNKPLFDPPPPLQIAAAKPEVVLPPKKQDRPAVEKANPLPPAPTTTERAAPDLKPDSKVAALITGGASDGKPSAADRWDARVRARIELMKHYPALAARQNQQDEVRVLLTVDRSGRLIDGRVDASRGFSLLDQAALEAVQRASPFPKPPETITGDRIRLSVIVRFAKRGGAG